MTNTQPNGLRAVVGQQHPKVTVFIPVYNREKLIRESVESVLAQTFRDFELLIIDDGSTDATPDVVAAIDDPRIRLVRNETNAGIPYTRNRGLELARGDYLAILDSDDRMRPQRLARQIDFLEAHPDYAVVGSWGRAIDDQGRLTRRIRIQPVSPPDVDAHLLFRCCISNRSATGRTEILRDCGYDNEFLRCQDYDMWVRLSGRYRLGNLPEVLVDGREHLARFTAGTVGLGQTLKQRIAARQLDELGMVYSKDDIAAHVDLSRTRKAERTPDGEILDWAEDWLARLLAANDVVGRYDPRAFADAIAEVWLKLCLTVATEGHSAAIARFLRSSLRRGATAGYRRSLGAALRRYVGR